MVDKYKQLFESKLVDQQLTSNSYKIKLLTQSFVFKSKYREKTLF